MSRRKRWEEKQAALSAPTVAIETPEKTALAAAESAVERARTGNESVQPRFQANPQAFFQSTITWLRRAELEEPPYASDSRARDAWLQQFPMLEPHLSGILASTASIDSNRGWSLTGGRNQVKRLTSVLHNFRAAPDLLGWRPSVRAMSFQFHGADLGAPAEIERDGEDGPVSGFFSVDPARCRLTGRMDAPLQYFPPAAGAQLWEPQDYLRVVDIAHNPERMNGLGMCSVSRALELAKVLVAVLMHDQESLGARAPKGLLLLKGITQPQWDTAMASRQAQMTEKERRYYGGVEVLASGMDDISATLVALSQLPAGFDKRTFTDLTLYGYALCFGYDAREFWPVSGGALGTATETETQHKKATSKGAGDFSKAHQEQLQRDDVLPDTVHFEYEERDIEGQLQTVALQTAQAAFARSLYESGLQFGQPLLAPDVDTARARALQLLAEAQVIPDEWTEFEEEVTGTDDDSGSSTARARLDRAKRDRLLSIAPVRRAAERFPREAIVRYQWPTDRVALLYRTGDDLLHCRAWPALTRALTVKPKAAPPLPEARDPGLAGLLEKAIAALASLAVQRQTETMPMLTAPSPDFAPIAHALESVAARLEAMRLTVPEVVIRQQPEVNIDLAPVVETLRAHLQTLTRPPDVHVDISALSESLRAVIARLAQPPAVQNTVVFPPEAVRVDSRIESAVHATIDRAALEFTPEQVSLLTALLERLAQPPIVNNVVNVPPDSVRVSVEPGEVTVNLPEPRAYAVKRDPRTKLISEVVPED